LRPLSVAVELSIGEMLAPSADAIVPTVIGAGTVPRIACSSSVVADVMAANPVATTWSSSSPLLARTVTKLPDAVLIVILIGASE
jgi:hypothetical protein